MKLSKNKKKICIISSSRAELGILRNLVIKLQKNKKLETDLVLIGLHNIYKKKNFKINNEIKDYNIKSFNYIKINEKTNSSFDILIRSSDLIKKISKEFKKKNYDCLIILGDRYEALVSSYCAVICGIPIIHISGGDETFGSYDNVFRHSISQFSNLHFVTNSKSKRKLIKMGLNSKKIFDYGSLSVENIKNHRFKSKKILSKNLNISFKEKNFIVTYHPETISKNNFKKLKILIDSVKEFKNFLFIFTGSNKDEGGEQINKKLIEYSKKLQNIIFMQSLGQKNYFNLLNHVDGVIGNSSSGITEVPSFKIGTINVGNRQDGRLKSKSVIDVDYSKEKITKAIKRIISNNFYKTKKKLRNPYEKKNSHIKIMRKILEFVS